jgi:hypothetical protein
MSQLAFTTDAYRSAPPLNLYAAKDEEAGVILFGTPGLKRWCVTGYDGEVRGMIEAMDYLYVVVGSHALKISNAGVVTHLGTVTNSTGQVDIAFNGFQVFICDEPDGYIYQLSTGIFAKIGDPDFPGCSSVCFQDGFFAFTEPNSGKWWLTAIYDGSDIDALDYVSTEGNPDNNVRIISDHRELWVFGEKSVEPYYNSGDATFPFAKNASGYIETGCGARWSVVQIDNSIYWLTEKGFVVKAEGYRPIIVSTQKVSDDIRTWGDWSDCTAYAWTWRNHTFYVLSSPTGNKTWVFDISTGLWHRWASFPNDGRHRSNCYCYFATKHLVGDYAAGIIYEFDDATFTDDGNLITREVESATIRNDGLRNMFFSSLKVEMKSGVGLVIGQGSDPIAMLTFSDDQGRTWSNEIWMSYGKIGEYLVCASALRLGCARHRIFRVRITDPTEVVIYAAHVNYTEGVA